VPYKSFNADDLEVVNKIKSNIPIVFISTDNAISYHFFRRKNIPFFWARKDKKEVFLQILRRYNVTAEDILFIGSKVSDVPCAHIAPLALCPVNVNDYLKKVATPLHSKSGEGVLTEVYLRYCM
jgi:3-deoxy-D-manno-octulosonate 8-phosphate phosphatase KdsC-like HAD superfamily phosphatase